jgi:hypothetical protein
MKNQSVSRKNFLKLFIYLFLFLSISQNIYAQQYPEMKIIHKNGLTVEGEDGSIDENSVSLLVDSKPVKYPLNDVQLVMVKRGLGGKYALYAGGGCAAVVLITIIAGSSDENISGDEKYSTGTLVLGGLLWIGIFTVGGYLIGNAADDWNTIYTAPAQSSILERFKFGFGANRRGQIRLGLSYNF